jgi:hypothetical protein
MRAEAELRSLGRRKKGAAHRKQQKRIGKAREKASGEVLVSNSGNSNDGIQLFPSLGYNIEELYVSPQYF